VEISKSTIKAFANVIIGADYSPYMRRVDLEDFFFKINGEDPAEELEDYSRSQYTEAMLQRFNKSILLDKVFREYFKPVNFVSTNSDVGKIIYELNKYLKFEGYELVIMTENEVGLRNLSVTNVTADFQNLPLDELSDDLIESQLNKCEQKIVSGDFDGAITNARTLIEGVFIRIIGCITGKQVENDGDLIKLYKKVQHVLNLEPGRKDISDSLKQILSGLNSIVNGLAAMRNKMSDAHATTYYMRG